jgi:spermidine synthase
MKRSRTVFEEESPESGRIRVVEDHRERRLIVAGDTLSVYPLDGNWERLRNEYWWHALVAVEIPRRPSVLLVGLGGGTQVHLLREMARPRAFTIIERDEVIIRVAEEWFALRHVDGLEFLCADAETVVPSLAAAGRRFDFIMEDAAYADAPESAAPLAQSLARLVAPGGVMVVNRHRRGEARGLAARLRPLFEDVRLRRVRREGENVLICCVRPRP